MIKEYRTPHVIFLCGIAGSGKSTVAQKLCTLYPERKYVIHSTDSIYEERGAALGWTYNEAFERISRDVIEDEFIEKLISSIHLKENIIIDQTNLTKKARKKKLDRLPKCYTKIACVVLCAKEQLYCQLEKRYKETGKYISAHVINTMVSQWEEPTEQEFDRIVHLT